ncbi:MAG: hypothetical protein AB8G16_04605 [Gammaproteobacteria bacterium]
MLTALCALTLAACGGEAATCEKPEPFQASRQGEPLAVPDDLSRPASSGKFDIPDAGRDKPVRGACGDRPPLRVAAIPEAPATPKAPLSEDDLPAPPTNAAPDAGATVAAAATTAAAVTGAMAGVPALTGNVQTDVRETVVAWTRAWREADGAKLVSFYSSEFEPPVAGETRDVWANRRITLLEQTGPADVRYDRLTIAESYAGASARFIQEFHNKGQIDALVKRLELVVEDGRWVIIGERVEEVL